MLRLRRLSNMVLCSSSSNSRCNSKCGSNSCGGEMLCTSDRDNIWCWVNWKSAVSAPHLARPSRWSKHGRIYIQCLVCLKLHSQPGLGMHINRRFDTHWTRSGAGRRGRSAAITMYKVRPRFGGSLMSNEQWKNRIFLLNYANYSQWKRYSKTLALSVIFELGNNLIR